MKKPLGSRLLSSSKARVIAQRFTELVKKSKSYRYRVDLTRRRLNLLHKAREMAKGISAIEFTFSGVNCRLAFRLNTGDFKFFNSEIEVANIKLVNVCLKSLQDSYDPGL